MTELQIHFEGLYKLHLASLSLEHGVRETADTSFQHYEPTHFVYAFFAFNSLYSLRWTESLIDQKRCEWNEGDERKKINAAVDFCCGEKESKVRLCKQLFAALQNIDTKVISKIRASGEKEKASAGDFRNSIKNLVKQQALTIHNIKAILGFIYLVRCNVFHGRKTTLEMKQEDQRQRFDIYTKVLTTFNQHLLDVAAERRMWQNVGDNAYIGVWKSTKKTT